jgi:hypothetical protein
MSIAIALEIAKRDIRLMKDLDCVLNLMDRLSSKKVAA